MLQVSTNAMALACVTVVSYLLPKGPKTLSPICISRDETVKPPRAPVIRCLLQPPTSLRLTKGKKKQRSFCGVFFYWLNLASKLSISNMAILKCVCSFQNEIDFMFNPKFESAGFLEILETNDLNLLRNCPNYLFGGTV